MTKVRDTKVDLAAKRYVDGLFGGKAKKLKQTTDGGLDIDEAEDDFAIKELTARSPFDIASIVTKSVDRITGLPTNMKLPENDFKEASSFFDFCSNFLSKESRFPFARQLWMMTALFGEWCPVCSNKKWISDVRNVPVEYEPRDFPDQIKFLKYGKCPKCKGTKADFVNRGLMKSYVEFDLEAGQRSGKSAVTSVGAAYITHKYLKYPKLSSVCEGIQSSTPLTATFVGYRFADAFNLLWSPVTDLIKTSPWFTDYHQMLTDQGKRYGVEFYRFKDIYLRYGHKNIELYPAGPSKRALRGRTRFLTAVDEIGWFPVEEDNEGRERASADEVYNALDRSLLTVRQEVQVLMDKGYNNFLPGIAINISSPSSQTDKIHRLVLENQNSESVLALNLPTWDVNPRLPKTSKVIKKAYKDNPSKAERDYGANPPLNAVPFVELKDIQLAFRGKNRADIQIVHAQIKGENRTAANVIVSNPMPSTPAAILAIDAGYSNNAFAISIAHNEGSNVVADVLLEIQPTPGYKLHYNRIYQKVLKPLIKDFNVKFLFADRWNSLAILHRAEEEFEDLKALQYSVKYRDFSLMRSYVTENRCILPKLEMTYDDIKRIEDYPFCFTGKPASHLYFQFATVKDKGNAVTKGDKYTDDLFRSLVLNISRLRDPKIMEELSKFTSKISNGSRVGMIATGRSGMQTIALPSFTVNRGLAPSQPAGALAYSGSPPATATETPSNRISVIVSRR